MSLLRVINGHRRPYRSPLLQVKRSFVPMVGAGLAIVVGGTLAIYAVRAYERMQAEAEFHQDGQGPRQDSSDSSSSAPSSQTRGINYLGLDIGSTYSKLAHLDRSKVGEGGPGGVSQQAQVATLLQNAEGRRAVPCYVHRMPDGKFTVGHLARAARFLKTDMTAFSPAILTGATLVLPADAELHAAARKVLAGFPFTLQPTGVPMGGEAPLPVSAILELVAADMLRIAIDQGIPVHQTATHTNISYPSFFSVDACLALEDACLRAGGNVRELVPDPICAYIGAIESGAKVPGREAALAGNAVSVAVVDIGGRVCQMGLLRISKNGSIAGLGVNLVNERSIFDIGGDWVDASIAEHIAAGFKERHGVDLLADPQAKQRLFDAAETAKIELSRSRLTQINIPYITATPKGTLHIDQSLTRAQLESLIEKQETRAAQALKDLLFDPSNSGDAPLAGVLLAGGGSRMHFAKRVVEKVTGMVAVETREPEALVAVGAAAYVRYKE